MATRASAFEPPLSTPGLLPCHSVRDSTPRRHTAGPAGLISRVQGFRCYRLPSPRALAPAPVLVPVLWVWGFALRGAASLIHREEPTLRSTHSQPSDPERALDWLVTCTGRLARALAQASAQQFLLNGGNKGCVMISWQLVVAGELYESRMRLDEIGVGDSLLCSNSHSVSHDLIPHRAEPGRPTAEGRSHPDARSLRNYIHFRTAVCWIVDAARVRVWRGPSPPGRRVGSLVEWRVTQLAHRRRGMSKHEAASI